MNEKGLRGPTRRAWVGTALALGAVQAHAAAAALFPGLADLEPQAFAGVRAATPDGLPLVGSYGAEGVMVARGARRNGWLFAPLIAETIADQLAGRPPSGAAAAFDPGRFR